MMKYVIVGSSGYLGGKIAHELKIRNSEVHGVYRTYPEDGDNILAGLDSLIQGDITEQSTIDKIISLQPKVLIYTASQNHTASEIDYQKSIRVDVAPLLELGRQLSGVKNFKKLIYFSTFQVYGDYNSKDIINDATCPAPQNMYALSHFLCEKELEFLTRTYGLNTVALRLTNAYGSPAFKSCDCWWLVLNDLCLMAMNQKQINLKSDGSPQRDFIHIQDICNVVEAISNTNEIFKSPIILASGKTTTILELAQTVAKVFHDKYGIYIDITKNENAILKGIKFKTDKLCIETIPFIKNIIEKSSNSLELGIAEVFKFLEQRKKI